MVSPPGWAPADIRGLDRMRCCSINRNMSHLDALSRFKQVDDYSGNLFYGCAYFLGDGVKEVLRISLLLVCLHTGHAEFSPSSKGINRNPKSTMVLRDAYNIFAI